MISSPKFRTSVSLRVDYIRNITSRANKFMVVGHYKYNDTYTFYWVYPTVRIHSKYSPLQSHTTNVNL
jgi:hypothetical protein